MKSSPQISRQDRSQISPATGPATRPHVRRARTSRLAAEHRRRAPAAALARSRRPGPSLTARLMGDPPTGRSALDRAADETARQDVRPVSFRPCPLLAVELIDLLDDRGGELVLPDIG